MTVASTSNWRTMRQRLAPMAERTASSCWGTAAGEQKDGAVGAADDEQQQYTPEEKDEWTGGVLLKRHDDGLKLQMPLLGKVLRVFLRELANDGVELRIGGCGRDVRLQLDPRDVG